MKTVFLTVVMGIYSILLKPVRTDFIQTITPEEAGIVSNHFAYFSELLREGKLLFAGRTKSASFGIALFSVANGEELKEIISKDPCIVNGVFNYEQDEFSIALLEPGALKSYATT